MLKLFAISLILSICGAAHWWSGLDGIAAPSQKMPLSLLLAGLSVASFLVTHWMVPVVGRKCLSSKTSLHGFDINKQGSSKIPESLGIVPGIVYLVAVIMFQPVFPSNLGEYNAALISVCFMLLLGFVDDVLDLRWSVKIGLSLMASLPLLVGYSGPTIIVVPTPLRAFLDMSSLDLGLLYHVYMCLVAIFCTNSINIYAGVNGLEVGQSIVIALAVLIHNVIELGLASDPAVSTNHLLSLFLLTPFMATSLGLFAHNKYPSSVFVGDSYTYFAGMTLAVAGILGHLSKTLMLFFVPQLLNFVLSLPQLLRIVPCPRHRLPKFVPKTGLLHYTPNFTLINAVLYIFGDMNERTLTNVLLCFQVACCTGAFFVRYYISSLVFY